MPPRVQKLSRKYIYITRMTTKNKGLLCLVFIFTQQLYMSVFAVVSMFLFLGGANMTNDHLFYLSLVFHAGINNILVFLHHEETFKNLQLLI